MQGHVEIAAVQGMKAGFNAYMAQLRRSGLVQAQAVLSEYEALSKRKRFARYCAEKGPDVLAYQAVMRTQPRSVTKSALDSVGVEPFAEPAGLAEEILAARTRLAELEAQLVSEPKVRKPRTRKAASEVKENLWREWAVRKHNIPTKVGATFSYKGKRRTSTFKVTRVTAEGVFSIRVA